MYKEYINQLLSSDLAVMSISVILLATAVILYSYFKTLRVDNHGKISICFLIGCFVTTLAIPLIRIHLVIYVMIINYTMFVGGFIFMIMWMSVLCFDIWFTFRNLQPASDGTDRFKYYCYYVFGVLGFLLFTILVAVFEIPGIVEYLNVIVTSVVIMFISIAITSVILLFIVGIKIFKMSRSSNHSEHLWLKEEKIR